MDEMAAREAFYNSIEKNELTLSQTLKAMRKLVKMTQPEFAQFVGVAPRVIIDIEREVANPRLSTLEKIAKPFGLSARLTKPL